MIVSHKGKFVVAAPVGLGAGPWLKRIAAEGDAGWLEIIGHPNGVVVPEGCEKYARYFIDAPQHRLPQLWEGKSGTPWEGPRQVRDDLEGWVKWYMWSMRRMYLSQAMESPPNGWGMRAEEGDWMFFEHPATLLRTFRGMGTSPLGEDAPWGRAEATLLKMEEYSRGWRELIKRVAPKGVGKRDASHELRNTVDLLRWHIPKMHMFYELDPDIVNAFLKESAWEVTRQQGI
jgi:hypothetical protein